MGYSKNYRISSLRTGVLHYLDYARQSATVARPINGGVVRTWIDPTGALCHCSNSGLVSRIRTHYEATAVTTGSDPVSILCDGSPLILPRNKIFAFTICLMGFSGNHAAGLVRQIKGVIATGNDNPSTRLLAPPIETNLLQLGAGLTATATADTTTGALQVTVSGIANTTINWSARIHLHEL